MNTTSLTLRLVGWSFVYTLLMAACRPAPEAVGPSPQPTDSVQINGYTYPTRLIGQQRWTTINYRGPGGMAYGTGTQKPIYGRYYTYSEARAIALPPGWRLPTEADWVTLVQSQGVVLEQNTARKQEAVKKLLSTTNWRSLPGTNASGFDAHPAGYGTDSLPPQDGDLVEFWATGGVSMSIQESSHNNHLLRFYGNDNEPSVRYTVRFVSGQ
ncbi:FISUMP domain-containing protein [Fibrella forsythiae]|uniref:Fibrobacter succinogenes major paralogous domain-containing protein n=1 Tax=Fibrella forsythiae TaxID=2817061 RepID=A0ABS3JUB0_9BACT|nr:FISUMP domain-containing protein [Fibrella forsythiae]MBO0953053.1 hypothetical protein [Fibrella forsythiae]